MNVTSIFDSAVCYYLQPKQKLEDNVNMVKFDGIKGQELLDVEESKDEITLIFKDNRFLFVKVDNGKLVCDSVPE